MIKNQLPKRVFKTGREVIAWNEIQQGFEVEVQEQKFIVISNNNVEKVSKTTGKAYKTRRLVIADINGNEMEIGADSFKKGSFIKRFNKQFGVAKVEVKTEVQEDDTLFWESHMMTEQEKVNQQNELYRILTERGLLQAYTDWERGKVVDKSTIQEIMKALDDSIEDNIDWDSLDCA